MGAREVRVSCSQKITIPVVTSQRQVRTTLSALRMGRYLQVADLENEDVALGEQPFYAEHPPASWIFPYAIGIFSFCAVLVLSFQFGYWWICKKVFGREDPIDPKELLAGLSEEQRNEAVEMVVNERSSNPTTEATKDKTEIARLSTVSSATLEGSVRVQQISISLKESKEEASDNGDSLSSPISSETTSKEKEVDGESGIAAKGETEGGDDEETKVLQLQKNSTRSIGNTRNGEIDDNDENEHVCPICLGDYDDEEPIFASQCSHKFHSQCILEWLHTKGHNDCPVCRSEMISEEEMVKAALVLVRREKENCPQKRGELEV